MQKPKHVCAAMSGGVDSSVMAHLLLAEGYSVTGATMKLYRPGMRVSEDGRFTFEPCGGETVCGSDADVGDAKAVCDRLGISHTVYDFGEQFCRHVIGDFVREYARCKLSISTAISL